MQSQHRSLPVRLLCWVGLSCLLAAGGAEPLLALPQGDGTAASPLGIQGAVLDNDSLDQVRGGFEAADGNLRFSFGIERAVYINGELVASTVLNLKDLQGAGAPVVLPDNAGTAFTVIQNGSDNSFRTQIGPNLAGTVIQNTLDGQRIVNATTINATVNSAQVMRTIALQSAIRDGLIGALRH